MKCTQEFITDIVSWRLTAWTWCWHNSPRRHYMWEEQNLNSILAKYLFLRHINSHSSNVVMKLSVKISSLFTCLSIHGCLPLYRKLLSLTYVLTQGIQLWLAFQSSFWMWQLKAGFEDITEQYTKQGIMLYLQTKDTGANLLLKLILDDIPEPLIL